MRTRRKKSFLHHHNLSFATAAILSAWIVLYSHFDSKTHLGSFFGNAIADWTGLLVTVLATKYFYEIGSAESRRPPQRWLRPVAKLLQQHSLTVFLLISGAAWICSSPLLTPSPSGDKSWATSFPNVSKFS